MAGLFGVDARHVDVAILYGIGMKDRAQHIARELRPETSPNTIQLHDSTGTAVQTVSADFPTVNTTTPEESIGWDWSDA